MSNFRKQYPDFASIEYQIRQAHAERSVAVATAFANGIIAAVRGIGRWFGPTPAARARNGAVTVKASVPRQAARA